MANLTDKIKSTWYRCIETLGQSAANMADNAKQKLNEINMEARRKEVVADLPSKLMQMWKDGVELPEELTDVLVELNGLEEELAAARAARLAKKMKPAITDGSDAETAVVQIVEETAEADADEAAEEPADDACMEDTEPEADDETDSDPAAEEASVTEAEIPAAEEPAAEEDQKTSESPVAFDF